MAYDGCSSTTDIVMEKTVKKLHSFGFGPATLGMIALGALGVLATTALPAQANPVKRHVADQHGGVRVIGSTMSYDCGSAQKPVNPAIDKVDCDGQQNTVDTAGDIYWRDHTASTSIAAKDARTSATLDLPAGANVTYARLYWSALKVGKTPDNNITLGSKSGAPIVVNSDHCGNMIDFPFSTHPDWFYYQCSANVTDYVQKWKGGKVFSVTDIDSIPLANVLVHVTYSAWTLVVFYEDPKEDVRNLTLFDGFQMLSPPESAATTVEVKAKLEGFLVPSGGHDAKMTVFAYEGDVMEPDAPSGAFDRFVVNDQVLFGTDTPKDDFFAGALTNLGKSYFGELDVPKLSGKRGSMSGYDLHTVDVTSAVKAGNTSANISVRSSYDKFLLGGFVTSITNMRPDFDDLTKTVKDLNGGAVLPDDILEYTITATNSGNDTATGVVLTDKLEPGLEFVSGSINLVEGGKKGKKTDVQFDDEGEYVGDTITVRLGQGATAFAGGTIEKGERIEVKFRAKVLSTTGQISNVGELEATGKTGGETKKYISDGDPSQVGKQATVVVISQCNSDADCDGLTPHCDPETHTCVGCKTDADCTDPKNPACQPSGACGECSATNQTLCVDDKPTCEVIEGVCVFCTPGPDGDATICKDDPNGPICIVTVGDNRFCGCVVDSDCGSLTSGRVCDASKQVCVDGCRGEGGNGCPTDLECTSKDTSIGHCIKGFGTGGSGGEGAGGSAGAGAQSGYGGSAAAPSGGFAGDENGADLDTSGDTGGCACSTAHSEKWGGALASLLALGATLVLRRRRG